MSNKCTCGRSPTGNCVGWHKLSEEDYKKKKEHLDNKNNKYNFARMCNIYDKFKTNIDKPLAAILTLNTIANTARIHTE